MQPVPFGLNDVCRVIVPGEYTARFRRDFPSYEGEVTDADAYYKSKSWVTERR